MNLPRPDQRVMLTGMYAGLFACQVCVVPDATDEEILEACNREDPRTEGFSWVRVIRTQKDIDELKLRTPDRSSALPGTCVECPPRIHMVVM
jgi:hypothetical protein